MNDKYLTCYRKLFEQPPFGAAELSSDQIHKLMSDLSGSKTKVDHCNLFFFFFNSYCPGDVSLFHFTLKA